MGDRILIELDTEFANRQKYNIADPKLRPHIFYFFTDNCYTMYIRKLRNYYALVGLIPENICKPVEQTIAYDIYFKHNDLEYVKQEFRAILKQWVLSYYSKYEQIEFDLRKKQ